MSTERLMAIVALAASAALLAFLAPGAIRTLRTYLGTGRRRQADATGRAPEPGDDVARRLGTLASLGYHRIGETSLELPQREVFAWIVAADDGESYAILVETATPPPGYTGLYTAWPDGMWLGTLHPRGDPLTRPGLDLRVEGGELADAVAAHRTAVERLRGSRGAPIRVERLTDMLALDADYRQRFGGRELRPLVARALLPAGAALVLTMAALVLVAVLPR